MLNRNVFHERIKTAKLWYVQSYCFRHFLRFLMKINKYILYIYLSIKVVWKTCRFNLDNGTQTYFHRFIIIKFYIIWPSESLMSNYIFFFYIASIVMVTISIQYQHNIVRTWTYIDFTLSALPIFLWSLHRRHRNVDNVEKISSLDRVDIAVISLTLSFTVNIAVYTMLNLYWVYIVYIAYISLTLHRRQKKLGAAIRQ